MKIRRTAALYICEGKTPEIPLERKPGKCNMEPQLSSGFFPQEKACMADFGHLQ